MSFHCNLHWAVQNDYTDFFYLYSASMRVEITRGKFQVLSKRKKKTNDYKTLEPTFLYKKNKKNQEKLYTHTQQQYVYLPTSN